MTDSDSLDRIAPTRRPTDRVVMRQKWRNLTFLHWPVDPDAVRARLPDGLEIDTFGGKTYLGLVPFTMRDIRPIWSPPVPWLSHFHETNVRVYVKHKTAGPGVWFFSLDAANPIAVEIARGLWTLPYHLAKMSLNELNETPRESGGKIVWRSERKTHAPLPATLDGETILPENGRGKARTAEPGTLEFFLIERYLLFAHARGRLRVGQVHHAPYEWVEAHATIRENTLCAAEGFPDCADNPPLIHYSAGVDVDVFPLKPVG